MVTITEGMVVGSDTYFTRNCPVDFRSYVVSKVLSLYFMTYLKFACTHSLMVMSSVLLFSSWYYLFIFVFAFFKTTVLK